MESHKEGHRLLPAWIVLKSRMTRSFRSTKGGGLACCEIEQSSMIRIRMDSDAHAIALVSSCFGQTYVRIPECVSILSRSTSLSPLVKSQVCVRVNSRLEHLMCRHWIIFAYKEVILSAEFKHVPYSKPDAGIVQGVRGGNPFAQAVVRGC